MKMPWSDAWILLATIYAGEGKAASPKAVVAAADYINHAVPSAKEMKGAVARLTRGGYLTNTEGELAPTKKTMAYYLSITKPRRAAIDELKDMERFIGAAEPSRSATR